MTRRLAPRRSKKLRRLGQARMRAGGECGCGRPARRQGQLAGHRLGSGIGVGARRADRGDQYADLGIEPRHPGLLEPLAENMDQPVVLAEHVGPADVDACFGDHRGDVHAAHDRRRPEAAERRPRAVATSGSTSLRFGKFCSQNATRTSSDGRSRRTRSATACAFAADRGSALPCAVRTSVTKRAARIPSSTTPPSDRCADRRPRPASMCTARSRSTDSPRTQGD